MTEIVNVADAEQVERDDRLRHAPLPEEEHDADDEADDDQAADPRVGPVGVCLVGQADQEWCDRRGEQRGADVVDVARGVSARGTSAAAARSSTSETRPIGTLTKKIQCQPRVSVMKPAERRADEEREPEDRAEEAGVLAALGGRVQVRDDGERDREDRARRRGPGGRGTGSNCHISWLSAGSTDATRNRPIAKRMIGRRPNRSDSLP